MIPTKGTAKKHTTILASGFLTGRSLIFIEEEEKSPITAASTHSAIEIQESVDI